jgi:chemotaxis protein methyltransferase CheR
MDLVLPKGTEILLRELIQERTGILYDEEKESMLLDKLAPLVIDRGFQSFLDYYYLLKYDDSSDAEWASMIDVISVQETFFWREMDQIRALVDELIPAWAASNKFQPLRIWCAACATGEEPLSIAMAISEAGWFDRISIKIDATDLSRSALYKSRQGLYRERSFRNLPIALRDKFFEKEGNAWRVDPALHSRIRWDSVNLVNREDVARFASVPFILCRNVFIYFSKETIRRVVRLIAEFIKPPGYLFTGVSESLLKISNDFELTDIGNAFVYRRSKTQDQIANTTKFSFRVKGQE